MISKIKKNDTVIVLSGRDKGKQGKVTQLFPKLHMVVIEGVNVRVKHLRTRQRGRTGSRVQYAAPLPIAKVSLICPHCGKPTRVKVEIGSDNNHVRICRKCSASM